MIKLESKLSSHSVSVLCNTQRASGLVNRTEKDVLVNSQETMDALQGRGTESYPGTSNPIVCFFPDTVILATFGTISDSL